ncbi:hypothetical protein WR25_24045 [Diploscapter pachys]|uniref:ABC transmembrane type-1 domain-containing protein n=1 Tax=Diploscapter pachys TaxID=2018661 RepID=A0A2A2JV09_9BILA|nr:hypothetical protein WR25_24045 [Diploscapter pachys]
MRKRTEKVACEKVSCWLCVWVCARSARRPHPHSAVFISLLYCALTKLTLLVSEVFELRIDWPLLIETGLLMAEVALLSTSKGADDPAQKQKNVCPEEGSSIFNRAFFCWMNKILRIGANRTLEFDDLFLLADRCKAENLAKTWTKEWAKQRQTQAKRNAAKKQDKPTSIVWPFIRSQKRIIFFSTFVRVLSDCIHYLNPLLLKQLIEFVSMPNPPFSFGIAIACIMFVSAETRSWLQNFQVNCMFKLNVYYQSTLQNALLNKVLNLSPSARASRTAGEILNHAAVDVEILIQAIPYLQNLWSIPFQFTLAMIMLWFTLGPAALAGVTIMLLFIPLNYFSSRYIKRYQIAQMKVKDERTKLSNELLNGMKVVKLYAWEEPFEERINHLRKEEIRLLKKVCMASRLIDIFNATGPFLVAMASFTCFIFLSEDNVLTPSIAFVSLTVFNQLRQPMRIFAQLINTFVQAAVSNKRLSKFLSEEELQPGVIGVADPKVVKLEEASLNWQGAKFDPTLRDLNITVKPGQFIAIVGTVGSGKSSLLSALIGEMHVLSGKVSVGGRLGYAPQQSWITNKTIRDNVLFNENYNEEFYQKVVRACQLNNDFQQFPHGDLTEVGENGITLSGGQKARVGLARAVYEDGDIYLLDDPLSAVDAHVGQKLYNEVIGPSGILSKKTRLLVTHQLQYTREAEVILVMNEGVIGEPFYHN